MAAAGRHPSAANPSGVYDCYDPDRICCASALRRKRPADNIASIELQEVYAERMLALVVEFVASDDRIPGTLGSPAFGRGLVEISVRRHG
jgi:hypothetical protein